MDNDHGKIKQKAKNNEEVRLVVGEQAVAASPAVPPPFQPQTPPPFQQQTPPPFQQQTPPPFQQQTPPPFQPQTPPLFQQQTAPPFQQTRAQPVQTRQKQGSSAQSVPESKISDMRLRRLPGGWLLATLLGLSCMAAPFVETIRAELLSSTICSLKPYSAEALSFQPTMAAALEHLKGGNAKFDFYSRVLAQYTQKLGSSDNRVCYLQLQLAKEYLNHNREKAARDLVQQALQNLSPEQGNIPTNITQLLVDIGDKYDNLSELSPHKTILHQMTVNIGLKAAEFYPKYRPVKSLSNVYVQLGEHYEALGDKDLALKYYKMCYEISKNWGDTDYNWWRVDHILNLLVEKHQYQEAIPYAERAVKIAEKLATSKEEAAREQWRYATVLTNAHQYDKGIGILKKTAKVFRPSWPKEGDYGRVVFTLAGAYDAAGQKTDALRTYREFTGITYANWADDWPAMRKTAFLKIATLNKDLGTN